MIELRNEIPDKNNVKSPVLLLNQNYQPLNICTARRAISLMGLGKAEPIINSSRNIRSATASLPLPSVIRLYYMVKIPTTNRRLSRQALFFRDKFTCQYCSKKTRQLTIDHVIPRSKGGLHVWENVVSACADCNHKKAGRTPKEANMNLKIKPHIPNLNTHILKYSNKFQNSWNQFLSK